MSNRHLWLLGAADPEMEKIEELLRECGEQYMYARDEHGERVHPGNAYRAAVPDTDINYVYCVECAVPVPDCARSVIIDHHRPGDPGYGRPPSEFLSASSIGQVIARLAEAEIVQVQDDSKINPGSSVCIGSEWAVVTTSYGPIMLRHWRAFLYGLFETRGDIVFTAAADHCLGAAYRGQCPGVDPDELMKWRVEQRAKFQGREPEEIIADIEAARVILRTAPVVHMDDQPSLSDDDFGPSFTARDLRGQHIPELPDAAARDGECFLATVESPDGRKKVVCQVGSPDEIRAFMQWAPRQGIVDIYGDPERGFAGGYTD